MLDAHDADDRLGKQLRDVVARRDAEGLNRLVIDQYPHVLWGNYTKELPEEDRLWAISNLRSN